MSVCTHGDFIWSTRLPAPRPGPCSGYTSESTQQLSFAQFAFRVCLWGTSNFREEAKGSKMATSAANQKYSFDCKWHTHCGGCHFENTFPPIRVVLLIANGRPLWRPPFSRQNCIQSRDISMMPPRHYPECSPDIPLSYIILALSQSVLAIS